MGDRWDYYERACGVPHVCVLTWNPSVCGRLALHVSLRHSAPLHDIHSDGVTRRGTPTTHVGRIGRRAGLKWLKPHASVPVDPHLCCSVQLLQMLAAATRCSFGGALWERRKSKAFWVNETQRDVKKKQKKKDGRDTARFRSSAPERISSSFNLSPRISHEPPLAAGGKPEPSCCSKHGAISSQTCPWVSRSILSGCSFPGAAQISGAAPASSVVHERVQLSKSSLNGRCSGKQSSHRIP